MEENNPYNLNKKIDLSSDFKNKKKEEGVFWDSYNYSRNFSDSFLTTMVIKFSGGKIKNKKQAQIVLLLFAFLIIIISSIVIFNGGQKTSEEIIKKLPYKI